MCRINLKKIEARRPVQVQELKNEFKFDDALLAQPGQPLFEEPLFNLNPTLLTPLGMSTLGVDCFPFPEIEPLPSSHPYPSLPPQPAYQDLLASHSLGLDQPHFVPLPAASPSHPLPTASEDFSSPVPSSSDESGYRSNESSPPPHQKDVFGAQPCTLPADDYECLPNSKKRVPRNPSITDDKRERNRLAAEKYRRKGRELVTTLEKRCNDLSRENNDLRHRNLLLEEEIHYLRSLLTQNGLLGSEPATAPYCH